MLAIVLSLLFGLVAFAALAEIRASVVKGMRRGRSIRAELGTAAAHANVSQAARRTPRLALARAAA